MQIPRRRCAASPSTRSRDVRAGLACRVAPSAASPARLDRVARRGGATAGSSPGAAHELADGLLPHRDGRETGSACGAAAVQPVADGSAVSVAAAAPVTPGAPPTASPGSGRRARDRYSGPCRRGSAYSRGLMIQYSPDDGPYQEAPLQVGSLASRASSYEVEPIVALRTCRRPDPRVPVVPRVPLPDEPGRARGARPRRRPMPRCPCLRRRRFRPGARRELFAHVPAPGVPARDPLATVRPGRGARPSVRRRLGRSSVGRTPHGSRGTGAARPRRPSRGGTPSQGADRRA